MAKIPSNASKTCVRLIILMLIAAFPGHFSAQNDASTRPQEGNAPLEMLLVSSSFCTTDTIHSTIHHFYISKAPITRRLWNEVMGTRPGTDSADSLPVRNVSRDEVQLFILWLNQKSGMNYRLPTTMEWECAVRNGYLPDGKCPLCSDGGDATAGILLAMDDPEEIRAAEAARKAEQEQKQKAAEMAAADSIRHAEREPRAVQRSIAQQLKAERQQQRQNRLNALPSSVFFTLNAAYKSMPQWSFGFKIGTVRVVGWYFSFMTNFHYKGAFDPFQQNGHYVLTGTSKTSYLGGQLGLVVRPCRLLSLHVGAGYGYRALTYESDQGWHNYLKRNYYGPTCSAGVMFHVKNVALSAEATGMAYNLNALNDMRCAFGVRLGIGCCFPYHHDVKLKIKDERILVH